MQQLLEKSRPVRLRQAMALRQASRGLPQPKRLLGASPSERSSCLKKAGRSKAKPTARRPAPSKPRRLLGALYSHGEKPLWFKLNKKVCMSYLEFVTCGVELLSTLQRYSGKSGVIVGNLCYLLFLKTFHYNYG